MILFHTVPYLRSNNRFSVADKYGSWVAHQDIVRSVLQYSSLDGVHFYLPPPKEFTRAEIPEGIHQLRTEFPSHDIDVKRLSCLPAEAQRVRYVLCDNFDIFPALALSRFAENNCLFPISTVVHTIPRQSSLMGYANILLLAESFDAVVATSEAGSRTIQTIFEDVKHFMSSRLKTEIPLNMNIANIPLAVDDSFLRPQDSQNARHELNLPLESVIVMYLGRLSETFKCDLEPLLVTFGRLSIENPNLHFVVAGHDSDGDYASLVKAFAHQFGIGNRTTVITNFLHSVKPLLYGACDVFVSPADNFQETFGLSILEAMASGVPIVASDWSGYRDLIVHGQTGFLARTIWNRETGRLAEIVAPFPVKSSHFLAQQTVVDVNELYRYLKVLIDNKELRHRFGMEGRKRVGTRFNWKVVIKQYEELWKHQWGQLDSIKRRVDWYPPMNFEKQFGHFATAFLNDRTVFKASAIRRLPDCVDTIDSTRIPNHIDIEEAQRVKSHCELGAHTLKELVQKGNGTTRSAVTWLWKKGYIETDESFSLPENAVCSGHHLG